MKSLKSHKTLQPCFLYFLVTELFVLRPPPRSPPQPNKTTKQSSAPRVGPSTTHNSPLVPDSFRVPCRQQTSSNIRTVLQSNQEIKTQFLMFSLKQVYCHFSSFIMTIVCIACYFQTVWCQFQLAQQTSSVSNRGSETSSGGSGKALSKPSLPTNQQVVTRPCLCQRNKDPAECIKNGMK